MRNGKLGIFALVSLLIAALLVFPLDLYVSKPGGAYDLAPLVEVEDGDKGDIGSFSLMTISLAKATLFSYVYSKFSDERKILPASNVRRSGETDKEYNVRQKKMMSDSQFNAVTVAYEKAGYSVEVYFDGVFVMGIKEGSASDGILKAGDKIYMADGMKLEQSGQFYELIASKELGDAVDLSLERDEKMMDVSITLQEIPGESGRAGLGVEFQEDRTLTTKPEVEFNTSNIGGPSAGLLFTLEIMNQLIDSDISKGYKVAGTGEMLEGGTVGRIGGADFKVIAATRQGIEIFFVPDDDLPKEVLDRNPGLKTNYEEAVETAEKIGSKMKVVPVKTIDDALEYLDELEMKVPSS
ncbi:SepM family pheromone-processing serine protease [Sporosarcina sp. CAU 1771]